MDSTSSNTSVNAAPFVDATDGDDFIKTKEIMQKITPTFCEIDEKAMRLIERCVKEFASSVTCIAAGYKSLDIEASQNIGQRLPAPTSSESNNKELKSEHIIRSLDNMGYTDFVKPLTTYKTILKGKLMPVSTSSGATSLGKSKATDAQDEALKRAKLAAAKVLPPSAKSLVPPSSQSSSSSSRPSAAPSGPVSQPVPAAPSASLLGKMQLPPGVKPGHLIHPANAAKLKGKEAKEFKELLNAVIDRDLVHCNPPITETDFALKYGVNYSVVRKRIQVLRQANVMLNGLRFGVVPFKSPLNATPAVPAYASTSTASSADAVTNNMHTGAASGTVPGSQQKSAYTTSSAASSSAVPAQSSATSSIPAAVAPVAAGMVGTAR